MEITFSSEISHPAYAVMGAWVEPVAEEDAEPIETELFVACISDHVQTF